MRARVLFLGLLLFWAGPAAAQQWDICTYGKSGASNVSIVGSGQAACFDFTGSTDSGLIAFKAAKTHVCFDPNLASTGTATSEVYLRHCVSTVASANSCEKILVDIDGGGIGSSDDLPLNGDSGETTAQRRCIYDVPPGVYYIDIDTGSGGETSRVKVRGE